MNRFMWLAGVVALASACGGGATQDVAKPSPAPSESAVQTPVRAPSARPEVPLKKGWVRGTGMAALTLGEERARAKALEDALVDCIKQKIGVYIESELSQAERSIYQDNQEAFIRDIEREVRSGANGYVKSYAIRVEKEVRGEIVVIADAWVFRDRLTADMIELVAELKASGQRKLMVVVQEVRVGQRGGPGQVQPAALGTVLTKKLQAKGFDLLQQSGKVRWVNRDADAFRDWMANSTAVALAAGSQGADIVLVGQVRIKDQGKVKDDVQGLQIAGMSRIQVTGELQIIDVATREVFASKPLKFAQLARDYEGALRMAFKEKGKRAKQAFDGLFPSLERKVKERARTGQVHRVEIANVQQFRRQGRPLLRIFQDVAANFTDKSGQRGKAEQVSFGDGKLVVDVTCPCSLTKYQDQLFAHLNRTGEFATLDLVRAVGRHLLFLKL